MAVCLTRPGDQLHADRACTYGTVSVSDSGWSLSVLWVELRLFVVVVLYTWRATVCYRTWQSSNRAVYSRNWWTAQKSTVSGAQSFKASSDCPSCETAEQTAARLTAERCRSQLRRNAETAEQSAARQSSQRDCRQRQRQQLKSAVPLSRRPKSSARYFEIAISLFTNKRLFRLPYGRQWCSADCGHQHARRIGPHALQSNVCSSMCVVSEGTFTLHVVCCVASCCEQNWRNICNTAYSVWTNVRSYFL